MSIRNDWKKPPFKWKEYVCPLCKRNKGMIYLDNQDNLRYVCFCGNNISIKTIIGQYDFENKKFNSPDKISEKEITRKNQGFGEAKEAQKTQGMTTCSRLNDKRTSFCSANNKKVRGKVRL